MAENSPALQRCLMLSNASYHCLALSEYFTPMILPVHSNDTGKTQLDMYLTAIIDWYSRMTVGWNLSDIKDTGSVIQAVKDALAEHGTPGILNSDLGSPFTSREYRKVQQDFLITQSMDGKSRWADNIIIERWFRSLKT